NRVYTDTRTGTSYVLANDGRLYNPANVQANGAPVAGATSVTPYAIIGNSFSGNFIVTDRTASAVAASPFSGSASAGADWSGFGADAGDWSSVTGGDIQMATSLSWEMTPSEFLNLRGNLGSDTTPAEAYNTYNTLTRRGVPSSEIDDYASRLTASTLYDDANANQMRDAILLWSGRSTSTTDDDMDVNTASTWLDGLRNMDTYKDADGSTIHSVALEWSGLTTDDSYDDFVFDDAQYMIANGINREAAIAYRRERDDKDMTFHDLLEGEGDTAENRQLIQDLKEGYTPIAVKVNNWYDGLGFLGTFQTAVDTFGLHGFSRLFWGEETWYREYIQSVDQFFCDTVVLGGLDCWTSWLCMGALDDADTNNLMWTAGPDGIPRLMSWIVPEKAPGVQNPDGSYEYLYKVEFQVTNTVTTADEELQVELVLRGGRERRMPKIKVPYGETIDKSGGSAKVGYSTYSYTEACLYFYDMDNKLFKVAVAYEHGDGAQEDHICQPIYDAAAAPSAYVQGTATSSSSTPTSDCTDFESCGF
ncbi:MAG: hypothetical protein ABIJ08_05960, partial [Nanoarchaeota archaeon]